MTERRRVGQDKLTPAHEFERGLSSAAGQLYAQLTRHEDDVESLRVLHRGPMDWMCILKRVGPEGDPQVIFGTGYSFTGALLGLEGSLRANRWRADTPYRPNGSPGSG